VVVVLYVLRLCFPESLFNFELKLFPENYLIFYFSGKNTGSNINVSGIVLRKVSGK